MNVREELPLQDRGFIRRAQTADENAASPTSSIVECLRAVPIGGHRAELETPGAFPLATTTNAGDSARVSYAAES